MSKDFRQEYERHMKENTPDLWERIDAGLSEKKTAGASVKVKAPPQKHVRRIYALMTAAAALLFAAVLMPFVYNNHMGQTDNSAGSSQDTALQAAMGGIPENAADAAGPETQNDGLPESTAAAGQDGVQELGPETDRDLQKGTEDGTGEMQEKMQQESVKQEEANQESAGLEAAPEGEIYTVTAREEVAWAESDDTKTRALPVSRVYKAQIQDTGRIITVAVPEAMSLTLAEGGVYVLSLKAAEENSGYEYIIISAE